jgi:hypothetical protein
MEKRDDQAVTGVSNDAVESDPTASPTLQLKYRRAVFNFISSDAQLRASPVGATFARTVPVPIFLR